ncbi:F-box/kelch-repeat protein SKIP11 [Hibiscus syriacus]|uniref:F-box/kelch-repeat protein SKIP11 n=1 Tax=Hibiscus syriacus TaxID=106335 RepID=A0A6A3D0K3_HIBSY|nr:F-box/kelch-repeat protein At1g26930-like isoform X1 [Hibiscus syriacus]XP_039004197.1 F-box/kelch-repeat protein At1g26930-like isoform X1 [Hibiscus syriacus]XP_039004203.1 F-box/kelch-repeat protein At1g26930-like isoform X1 [Hibiscus syriacus]KAE8732961.1 F-box/kelch-repeat protein SKIP11 [Hibiscus syriacus]
MLENWCCKSCLVFPSSCQRGGKWAYMYHGKRPREFTDSDGCPETKLSKLSSDDSSSDDNNNNTSSPQDSDDLVFPDSPDQSDGDGKRSCSSSDMDSSLIHHCPIALGKPDLDNQSDNDSLSDSVEESLEEQSEEDGGSDNNDISDSPKEDDHHRLGGDSSPDLDALTQPIGRDNDYYDFSDSPEDGHHRHAGDSSSDMDALIQPIGRDNSISCLIKCSRSDYGSIAMLNRSFRSLIRSGEIYKLRRQNGVVEHWVYFSCHVPQWEAFDPSRHKWMLLPRMPHNECFIFSDKESLAVGTELLVFGKEVTSQVIYRYCILTNSWTSGTSMNSPRWLFGSASLGEIAILAGGCDSQGNILNSAEMYNSETQKWETLPSMNKPRKMCSGVFMDKKFYVIGGIGGKDARALTCGEEYDLGTKKWTEIPNMSPGRSGVAAEMPAAAVAPPLVAVVNKELYAADHADMEVKKYDKEANSWLTIGRLPERAVSMNGWGLAFRACGDRLIVIGGPRALGEGFIELNSWVPNEGPPEWNLLARKQLGNFVYNCAVMGC